MASHSTTIRRTEATGDDTYLVLNPRTSEFSATWFRDTIAEMVDPLQDGEEEYGKQSAASTSKRPASRTSKKQKRKRLSTPLDLDSDTEQVAPPSSSKRAKLDTDEQPHNDAEPTIEHAGGALWYHAHHIKLFASDFENGFGAHSCRLPQMELRTIRRHASSLWRKRGSDPILLERCVGRAVSDRKSGLQTSHWPYNARAPFSSILSLPNYDEDHGETLGFSNRLSNILMAAAACHESGIGIFEIALYLVPTNGEESDIRSEGRPSFLSTPILELDLRCTFRFQNDRLMAEEALDPFFSEARRRMLSFLFPSTSGRGADHDLRFFFSCLHAAPSLPDGISLDDLQPEGLEATLLPFQRRSVRWLLDREGCTIEKGRVRRKTVDELRTPALFWEPFDASQIGEVTTNTYWYNRITGQISRERPYDEEPAMYSLLAEVMGLGKTVEIIALILFRTPVQRNHLPTYYHGSLEAHVKPIKATLIVTPLTLIQQWVDEMKRHAPGLSVLVYEGRAKLMLSQDAVEDEEKRARLTATRPSLLNARLGYGESDRSSSSHAGSSSSRARSAARRISFDVCAPYGVPVWQKMAQQYDVIITTYKNLQADLNVARPPVKRPRRETVDYAVTSRPRSPLVLVHFNRVVMDEVQQVGGGGAAEMVSLTMRDSSIAVSGTPARSQIGDLIHVLNFLRVPEIHNRDVWPRLLSPAHANQFREMFDRIGIRTPKQTAQREMNLPEQSRMLVPIELGPVEKTFYDEKMAQSLTELGLDARGVALDPDWTLDAALLRTCLRKLRQACTHPAIGSKQRTKAKTIAGHASSIDDVLRRMIEDNERTVFETRRTKVQERLKLVMILLHLMDEKDEQKLTEAVDKLQVAVEESEALIKDIKAAKEDSVAKHKRLKNPEKASELGSEPQSDIISVADGSDSEFDDPSELASGADRTTSSTSNYSARIREVRVLLHKAYFLSGDVHHRLGNAASEDISYSRAEEVRRSLLARYEQEAQTAMSELQNSRGKMSRSRFDILRCSPSEGEHIKQYLLNINKVIGVLSQQADLLWQWREKITQHVLEGLSNEGDDRNADGEEYTRALNAQNSADLYLQAIAALLADRRERLVAERTALAIVEHKETGKRVTKRSKAIYQEEDMFQNVPDDQDETTVLRLELQLQRRELQNIYQGKSLKGAVLELAKSRGVYANKDGDQETDERQAFSKEELSLAKKESSRLKAAVESQLKANDEFERDLQFVRRAFNVRVLYFRHLQALSDSVADVNDGDEVIQQELTEFGPKMERLQEEIRKSTSKARYLKYLETHMSENTGDEDDEERCCILCKTEFSKGVVTGCAHIFCDSCINAWMKKVPEGRACPVCRENLDVASMHKIRVTQPDTGNTTTRATEVTVEDLIPGSAVHSLSSEIEYNCISQSTLQKIHDMDTFGNFGSKMQTLVQHLLYLRDTDIGSKSIVFSAWSDSLHLIAHALESNGVTFTQVDARTKVNPVLEFQRDPACQVLLLHGERNNAGLNVTVAKYVFLLEPVVNHAFEVQAISRVDRLGQDKETTVFCYYAQETVEKHILDLAYHQGHSLYATDTTAMLEEDLFADRSTASLPAARRGKVQKGDFVASEEDMLRIMFPALFIPVPGEIGYEGAMDAEPV